MQVSFHLYGEYMSQEITNVYMILHRGEHIKLYHYGNAERRYYYNGKLAFVKRQECADIIRLDSKTTQITVKQ